MIFSEQKRIEIHTAKTKLHVSFKQCLEIVSGLSGFIGVRCYTIIYFSAVDTMIYLSGRKTANRVSCCP